MMKFKLAALAFAATTFATHAAAGVCGGSPGCWSIDCNNDIECESAGCGTCAQGPFFSPVRRAAAPAPKAPTKDAVSLDGLENVAHKPTVKSAQP